MKPAAVTAGDISQSDASGCRLALDYQCLALLESCNSLFKPLLLILQEAKAKDAITQLKAEIANLTRLAEAGSALSMGEEATLNELMKQKEELTRERDSQVGQTGQPMHSSSYCMVARQVYSRHKHSIRPRMSTHVTATCKLWMW